MSFDESQNLKHCGVCVRVCVCVCVVVVVVFNALYSLLANNLQIVCIPRTKNMKVLFLLEEIFAQH